MKAMLKLLILLTLTSVAACGGWPTPKINQVGSPKGTANFRLSIVATNYGPDWDEENVRLRISQEWLNDEDVPTNSDAILDSPFNQRGGDFRHVLQLRDSAGESSRDLILRFDLVSGKNAQNENVSASTTVRWYVPSAMSENDFLIVAQISRSGPNNYRIDVVYAMEPISAEIEQILPSEEES